MDVSDLGLDDVLAQLSQVAIELSELPSEAIAERLALRERQKALRARSRQLLATSGDILSADELRTYLLHLEERRAKFLDDTRLSHLAAAQTGHGGGIDPKVVHDMHRDMDAAFDLEGMTAEIERLRRRLKQLEGG